MGSSNLCMGYDTSMAEFYYPCYFTGSTVDTVPIITGSVIGAVVIVIVISAILCAIAWRVIQAL